MRWFGRRRRSAEGSLDRAADGSDAAHLEDFARTRRGVEAYVEPPTTMTATTVVLVAHDGNGLVAGYVTPMPPTSWPASSAFPPTTPRSSGTHSACATGTDAGAAEVDARLRRGPGQV